MRAVAMPAALVVLAGCLGTSGPTQSPASLEPDFSDLGFLDADHDHRDPDLHVGEWRMNLAWYDGLSPGVSRSWGFGELDAAGNVAAVAVTDPPGVVLIDLTHPDQPRRRGTYFTQGTIGWDVKLSPDGKLAFLGVANHPPFFPSAVATLNDPLRLAGTATSDGIHVIDVSNPSQPRLASFYSVPELGVHMMDVHVIGGDLYVVSATPNYSYTGLVTNYASFIDVARLDAITRSLTHVSDYRPPEAAQPGTGFATAPHDMTIVDDPVEGPLLVAAYVGINVASLKDPARPRHIATWNEEPDYPYHTVMTGWIEGRRLIVLSPEFYSGNQQPIWIFHATDLGKIQRISSWLLPGGVHPFSCCYYFSPHNVNLLEGRLYVAHFHAGAWVLDLSTWERVLDPVVVGFYEPHETQNMFPGLTGPQGLPDVWDVLPARGRVLVSDATSGVYVLRTDWTMPDALPYGTRGMTQTM